MVPDGWKIHSVDYLFEVKLGKMLNKEAKNKEPQFPYLTNINVRWGLFNTTKLNTMHFSDKEREKFSLKAGDIIMCEGGEVGRCAIWNNEISPCYYQKALHRLRPKTKILSEYFQSYMESIAGTKTLENHTSRTSIAHLTKEKLLELPVKVPPLQEQKRITQILSTWDKAIMTTGKIITNSQQQKKRLMQQLLTGKKRLQGFDEKWKKIHLREVLSEGKKRNKNNKVERVLSVTNRNGFVLPADQFSKRVASDNVTNYKIVREGQFGYNPSRLNVGSFARLDEYDIGILSPMYVVFIIDESVLNSDYFLAWMNSNEAKQRINSSTQGSVRDSVSFKAIGSFPFKLPEIKEQKQIAQIIMTADNEIIALKRQLDYLKQEKTALMQQLLTGKLRVITK